MTLEEIKRRVAEVEATASAHDDEKAHGLEDELMRDFIRYAASADDSLAEQAREVLKTENLEFGRW